jgi:glycosyltransferase involved in cell wall biosynthesis
MSEQSTGQPTISVLMPVYNAGRYLHQAIDSILRQTFGDFEFICVNDGSTDDSPKILRECAGRDPRIRIIDRANGGVTSALNAGLAVARGEFVARMDADDVADLSRFQRQLQYMNENPKCVAVGCLVIQTDAAGVERNRSRPILSHEEITDRLWNGDASVLPHFGAFIRRTALTQIGNYREQFRTAQDLDLFLRLSEIGQLANVAEYLMFYRVHENSVGGRLSKDQAKNSREILRQAYERRGMKLPAHLEKWSNLTVALNQSRWAWQALEQHRYADARKLTWSVLRRQPLTGKSWYLAFHTALGPCRPFLRATVRRLRGVKS